MVWMSILGLLHVLGSLGYCAVSFAQIVAAVRSQRGTDMVLRSLQLIFAPVLLLQSGGILFFHGWRMDPILQFQESSMSILIAYLILLDLKKSNRIN